MIWPDLVVLALILVVGFTGAILLPPSRSETEHARRCCRRHREQGRRTVRSPSGVRDTT